MKIKTKNENKKNIIVLSLVILVLVLGIGVFYFINKTTDNKNNNELSAPQRSTSDKDQAEEIQDSPSNKENTPNTDSPPPASADEKTGKAIVQMITSVDISDNTVYIRGGLQNVVYDGVCYADLTSPNGELIRKETTLLQNASTTDCKTIAISTKDLAKGRWSYTLNYTSTKIEGKTNATSFDIQ